MAVVVGKMRGCSPQQDRNSPSQVPTSGESSPEPHPEKKCSDLFGYVPALPGKRVCGVTIRGTNKISNDDHNNNKDLSTSIVVPLRLLLTTQENPLRPHPPTPRLIDSQTLAISPPLSLFLFYSSVFIIQHGVAQGLCAIRRRNWRVR